MVTNPIIKKIEHGGVKSLIKRAIKSGIKVKTFPKKETLLVMEHRGRKIFIRRGSVPLERRMGDMTKNKEITKIVLSHISIKTPKGFSAGSLSESLKLLKKKKLSYPLIVKPIDGSLARGVTWDIRSRKDLNKAIIKIYKNKSYSKPKKFLVEEMFEGDEYRILILSGKAISCVKKIPASVIGDGKSKIRELIGRFNSKRIRGFEIKIDKVVEKTLRKNRLTSDSILPKNYNLRLRYNLNMSDGGRAINYTHKMNNYFKEICERAIRAVGLTYGGIDLLTKNITSKDSHYVIIEINPNPYYNMHEKPLVEGKGIDVSMKILKKLFPSL